MYFPDSDTAHYFADEDTRVYPASTTKLLTILAALDIMPPDELVEPGDEVYSSRNRFIFGLYYDRITR